jgi:hypothetical protein
VVDEREERSKRWCSTAVGCSVSPNPSVSWQQKLKMKVESQKASFPRFTLAGSALLFCKPIWITVAAIGSIKKN